MLPDKLQRKLGMRELSKSLRVLSTEKPDIDFSSNDYLGFSSLISTPQLAMSGATGSRLLSGHSALYEQVEREIAAFHKAPAALLFNSGYDANIGLISSVAMRGDLILYDELVHASIRDGIQLSNAKSLKFRHNDMEHLQILLDKFSPGEEQEVYVITESVFSMDGDQSSLQEIVKLIAHYPNVHLILDEAHALGVVGVNGEGMAQHLGVEQHIFARVMTYGKALGAHGAAVLGSDDLVSYLINFARSFIYTTALPPHSLHCIQSGYGLLQQSNQQVQQLQELINKFNRLVVQCGLRLRFRESVTAIQVCIIPSNQAVKAVARALQTAGFDVRPIMSPTVAQGQERLRICLHSYNTVQQCEELLQIIARILKK